jgi:hypothetical protein
MKRSQAERAAWAEMDRTRHHGPDAGKGIGRDWLWKGIARIGGAPDGEWYVCEVSDQREPPLSGSGVRVVPGSALPHWGFREIIGTDSELAQALTGATRSGLEAIRSVHAEQEGAQHAPRKDGSGMWESAAKKKSASAAPTQHTTNTPTLNGPTATKPLDELIGKKFLVKVSGEPPRIESIEADDEEALELDWENAEYSTFEEIRKARHEEFPHTAWEEEEEEDDD